MSSGDAGESSSDQSQKTLFCPSAQPGLDKSVILAVVNSRGTGSPVTFLDHPVKVSDGTLLTLTSGQLSATKLFRFAAPCEKSGCSNWSGCSCRVAERLVQILPCTAGDLPPCRLRPVCRWFAEQGGDVCMRCPQVITDNKEFEARLNSIPSQSANVDEAEACNGLRADPLVMSSSTDHPSDDALL